MGRKKLKGVGAVRADNLVRISDFVCSLFLHRIGLLRLKLHS